MAQSWSAWTVREHDPQKGGGTAEDRPCREVPQVLSIPESRLVLVLPVGSAGATFELDRTEAGPLKPDWSCGEGPVITTAHEQCQDVLAGHKSGMWLDVALSVAGKFVAKLACDFVAPGCARSSHRRAAHAIVVPGFRGPHRFLISFTTSSFHVR